MKYKSSCAIR